jgi:hypothetical protein
MDDLPEKRLTRDEAEQLLHARDSGPGTHRVGVEPAARSAQPGRHERLAQLLAAAAAPTAGDPATYARALAAFQQAQSAPDRPRRRFTAVKAAVLAATSTKLAAGVALAAAATGGIALAASTGALSGTSGTHHPTKSPAAGSSASPSPNIKGLCTAYQAGAITNKGKAAQNPAFRTLARAAGGADNIGAYCVTTLNSAHPSTRPRVTPSAAPTHPTGEPSHSHPSGKPTGVPSHSHPHGKPTGVPSHSHPHGKPTGVPSHSHPHGKPTAVPSHPHPHGKPSHSHPHGKPTAVPSHPHPHGKPTAVPSHPHPHGKPTAVPSRPHPHGKPSHSHQHGKPTSVPSHSHPGGKP